MCSKPKVCYYLKSTFITKVRNRDSVLLVDKVWDKTVVESFAVTMMRYHTTQPNLLLPFIRISEPSMHAPEPWANLLWLGLAAPESVLEAVRGVAGMMP